MSMYLITLISRYYESIFHSNVYLNLLLCKSCFLAGKTENLMHKVLLHIICFLRPMVTSWNQFRFCYHTYYSIRICLDMCTSPIIEDIIIHMFFDDVLLIFQGGYAKLIQLSSYCLDMHGFLLPCGCHIRVISKVLFVGKWYSHTNVSILPLSRHQHCR